MANNDAYYNAALIAYMTASQGPPNGAIPGYQAMMPAALAFAGAVDALFSPNDMLISQSRIDALQRVCVAYVTGALQGGIQRIRDLFLIIIGQLSPLSVPNISGLSPNSGTTGDRVTISGDNFAAALSVSFASIVLDPKDWTLIDDATIKFTVPNLGHGATVRVRVTNAQGDSPPVIADLFHWNP